MKKLTTSINLRFLGVLLLIGCASHPISHKKDAPLAPKELKPTSKILVLTYMSNRESVLRVELLGITNIYSLKVTDTDAISSHLSKALKENVNAKIIPSSALDSSPTFKSLDEKYKGNSNLHNLNKGQTIYSNEKQLSFDFNDIPNDSELDATDAVGALFLQVRHPKTKGLQPSMVENSGAVMNEFFSDFANHFKISKKKK